MGATMSLTLFIDEVENKVVFAEGNRELVDVLLSFLVIPIGSAVRLAGSQAKLGCIDSLYKSVESFDIKQFNTEACKKMLLNPTDANRTNTKRLAAKISYRPFRYYACQHWNHKDGQHRYWSSVKGSRCWCRETMIYTLAPVYSDKSPSNVGVFLKGRNKYFITDDLRVSIVSAISTDELRKFGVYNIDCLREKKVIVRTREILRLFKHALTSKTPLTDTFVGRKHYGRKEEVGIWEALEAASLNLSADGKASKMTMDLVVNKSDGEFLYAKAKDDVINFFLSFLTFPLGLLSNLCNGGSSVGCIDQLWSSAKLLTEEGQMRTEEHSNILLKPKLSPHHSFKDQILNIEEGVDNLIMNSITLSPINPKSPTFTTKKDGSFVNGPATFVISDNLEIKAASASKDLSAIREHGGTEVISVTIGELEGLKLLQASLTSTTPLTTVFCEELAAKKPMVEAEYINRIQELANLLKEKRNIA